MTRQRDKRAIINSRSYSGLEIDTDHRLDKAVFKVEWNRIYRKSAKTEKINLEKLNDNKCKEEYCQKVEEIINKGETTSDPQKQWDNITNACLKAAKETLKKCREW